MGDSHRHFYGVASDSNGVTAGIIWSIYSTIHYFANILVTLINT